MALTSAAAASPSSEALMSSGWGLWNQSLYIILRLAGGSDPNNVRDFWDQNFLLAPVRSVFTSSIIRAHTSNGSTCRNLEHNFLNIRNCVRKEYQAAA